MIFFNLVAANAYMSTARTWLRQAYRPATRRQHRYAVRLYTGLAQSEQLDPFRPDEQLAISFVVFLAKNFKTQKTVRSLLSTLVTCLARAGIDTHSFESRTSTQIVRSISINKRATTRQRPPVGTDVLQRVFSHWRATDRLAHTLITAVLLMFVTSVRQSNLFPTSVRAFDSTRQMTWGDVIWRKDYVKINIKWGKAQQKSTTRYQKIPRAASHRLCTYRALSILCRSRDTRRNAPLITFADGNPIPVSIMNRKWRSAMKALGLQEFGFTLHSLRRGGARFLQASGVDVHQIASHAGWKSSAVFDCVQAPQRLQAYSALKSLS